MNLFGLGATRPQENDKGQRPHSVDPVALDLLQKHATLIRTDFKLDTLWSHAQQAKVQGGGYSFVEAVVAIIDTLQEKRALHHKIAKLVGPEEQQQHQQRVLDKFAQGKDRSPEEEIRQKEFVDDLKILWERTVKRGHILLDRAEEEKIQRDNSALLKTISELHRVVEHMDKVGDFLIKPAELELQELEQEPRHGYFLAARYSCPIFRRSRGT